ncbi:MULTISPECIES: hypothetical protein [Cyanophyceae]|uniref:hypothetical protein n=1 Tax=Cyanophyceae TaxID=3028117 RepID=UPI00232F932D|nr:MULTISPECIES: hypothetical protein [Cyanophyceae]MDB9356823.1 hypothetical protein [Nodularia spumigena CS-587/03]MDB9316694.1 hypothetical protein [Nodularia spumigena CS-590/01A]MDB9324329.1 hypothetical protein [Nodularia spumigena CS-591/07A]MDB9325799.1 hypothetical protein [Nodularia spumigena CS-590/02]MDB9331877.1 hypothetical protein [Nodularia spumigena CS-591/04]
MAAEPTSTLTKKYISAAKRTANKPKKVNQTAASHQWRLMAHLGHLLTVCGEHWVQLLENQGVGQ